MEVVGMVKSISRSFLLQFRNVAPSCDWVHLNDRPYQVLDFEPARDVIESDPRSLFHQRRVRRSPQGCARLGLLGSLVAESPSRSSSSADVLSSLGWCSGRSRAGSDMETSSIHMRQTFALSERALASHRGTYRVPPPAKPDAKRRQRTFCRRRTRIHLLVGQS